MENESNILVSGSTLFDLDKASSNVLNVLKKRNPFDTHLLLQQIQIVLYEKFFSNEYPAHDHLQQIDLLKQLDAALQDSQL